MLQSLTLCNAVILYPPLTGVKSFQKAYRQKSYTWTEDLLSAMTAMHGTFLEHKNYFIFEHIKYYTT